MYFGSLDLDVLGCFNICVGSLDMDVLGCVKLCVGNFDLDYLVVLTCIL
jgi:hypothetical protein